MSSKVYFCHEGLLDKVISFVIVRVSSLFPVREAPPIQLNWGDDAIAEQDLKGKKVKVVVPEQYGFAQSFDTRTKSRPRQKQIVLENLQRLLPLNASELSVMVADSAKASEVVHVLALKRDDMSGQNLKALTNLSFIPSSHPDWIFSAGLTEERRKWSQRLLLTAFVFMIASLSIFVTALSNRASDEVSQLVSVESDLRSRVMAELSARNELTLLDRLSEQTPERERAAHVVNELANVLAALPSHSWLTKVNTTPAGLFLSGQTTDPQDLIRTLAGAYPDGQVEMIEVGTGQSPETQSFIVSVDSK